MRRSESAQNIGVSRNLIDEDPEKILYPGCGLAGMGSDRTIHKYSGEREVRDVFDPQILSDSSSRFGLALPPLPELEFF